MKRINFVRYEEELAGAHQCIVCLSGMLLLNLAAALGYHCDAMTPLLALIWIAGVVSFGLAAVFFAYQPEWKAQRLERERLISNRPTHISE